MTDSFQVLVMGGEGIGPEVTTEAVRVLKAASRRFSIPMEFVDLEVGETAYQKTGQYLPAEAEERCDVLASGAQKGAIIFGATADEPIGILRKKYELFANLRPIQAWPHLLDISPLREDRVKGTEILIVRELVSGIYYGKTRQGVSGNERWASQELYYSESEVERILEVAFSEARHRRGRVTWVHKGNVIQEVFGLWRDVMARVASRHNAVKWDEKLADTACMELVLRPKDYDVICTTNLFGDLLSDVGAGVVGSIGLLPSASLNGKGFGLYECVGGTAPGIAGTQKANPIATILSAALMLRFSVGHRQAADVVECAARETTMQMRTPDIAHQDLPTVGTSEIGEAVANRVADDAWTPASNR